MVKRLQVQYSIVKLKIIGRAKVQDVKKKINIKKTFIKKRLHLVRIKSTLIHKHIYKESIKIYYKENVAECSANEKLGASAMCAALHYEHSFKETWQSLSISSYMYFLITIDI